VLLRSGSDLFLKKEVKCWGEEGFVVCLYFALAFHEKREFSNRHFAEACHLLIKLINKRPADLRKTNQWDFTNNLTKRLTMQAILYATTGDIAPKNSRNASRCAKNKLNLLPEHTAQIATAFIHQLSLARLSSYNVRILTTIYDQTIAYNKREDDMNGTRLQQLTGIRGDSANKAVSRLAALNIIITHQGHYGKWMAINFDFKNWGEPSSDTTTNDPRCLLSEGYQSELVDDETLEFKLYSPPEKRKKEPSVTIKEEENKVLPSPSLPAPRPPGPR
jgi:phage replication O-like protein O